MDIDELVMAIGNQLASNGASDVELLQIEQKTKLAKRLVICSAQDCVMAKKLALDLKEEIKDTLQCFHCDGIIRGEWIVLDFNEIIVHIFTNEARKKFNIEKLYKDAKNFVDITDKK